MVCKLGKVLTVDNLVMRGMVLANWCVMCKNSEETVDDLPLHCPMELWILIFPVFGVNWVMPKMVKDLLQGWEHGPKTFRNKVWNVFHCCLMWHIWREMNRRSFEDQGASVQGFKSQLIKIIILLIVTRSEKTAYVK